MRYTEKVCVRYQHAVEIIAKRWTALILKVMMQGSKRFSELADELEVVSDRVLSERLKELEQEGIIERRVFAEVPVRVEYTLTKKGLALNPVLEALENWSHEWISLESLQVPSADEVVESPIP